MFKKFNSFVCNVNSKIWGTHNSTQISSNHSTYNLEGSKIQRFNNRVNNMGLNRDLKNGSEIEKIQDASIQDTRFNSYCNCFIQYIAVYCIHTLSPIYCAITTAVPQSQTWDSQHKHSTKGVQRIHFSIYLSLFNYLSLTVRFGNTSV